MTGEGVRVSLDVPASAVVAVPRTPSGPRPHLPHTGFELLPVVLLAVLLLLAGAALVVAARTRPRLEGTP